MGGPGSGRKKGSGTKGTVRMYGVGVKSKAKVGKDYIANKKTNAFGKRQEILRANYNTAVSHSKGMGANKLAFRNAATKNKSAVAKMKRK
jgi:hypothetical protein